MPGSVLSVRDAKMAEMQAFLSRSLHSELRVTMQGVRRTFWLCCCKWNKLLINVSMKMIQNIYSGVTTSPAVSLPEEHLPIDMLLPVLWWRRSICICPGKDDMPFTFVHHTACLLIVVEWHRGWRDCFHIYWDVWFTVNRWGNRTRSHVLHSTQVFNDPLFAKTCLLNIIISFKVCISTLHPQENYDPKSSFPYLSVLCPCMFKVT